MEAKGIRAEELATLVRRPKTEAQARLEKDWEKMSDHPRLQGSPGTAAGLSQARHRACRRRGRGERERGEGGLTTQVVLTDNDLKPEGYEDFDMSMEIIDHYSLRLRHTPYERGHKIKDEEAFGAMRAR